MPALPEAVTGYPRWEGDLSRFPRFGVIALQELRRAWWNPWTRAVLILAYGYAVLTLGQLYALSQSRPGIHTVGTLVDFLDILPWAGLALAAVAAGPALLEDRQFGALELYLSRAATRWSHLGGKALAVLALVFAGTAGPGLVYWAGSWLVFDDHPEAWAWRWLGILGFGLLWAVVVAGVGLGLSCLLRSSRAATLVLFGGVALVDVLFGRVLTAITREEHMLVLSPVAGLMQQTTWLLGADAPHAFPWWWGLLGLGALAVLGWGAVAWRHPRLRGVA